MNYTEIAKIIDHTILKATATPNDIKKLCEQALEHQFASVCISPIYVPLAHRFLKNSSVAVCTVVGFPLGASASAVKVSEALTAINMGASEIDMVLAIGLMKAGQYDDVLRDIEQVVIACHSKNVLVKVILETCYLNDEEIIKAVKMCEQAGADFVKTSTGFGSAGATVEHVKLMKENCLLKVKASGGVRTTEDALNMINAGATRLGTSNSLAIIGVNENTSENY